MHADTLLGRGQLYGVLIQFDRSVCTVTQAIQWNGNPEMFNYTRSRSGLQTIYYAKAYSDYVTHCIHKTWDRIQSITGCGMGYAKV